MTKIKDELQRIICGNEQIGNADKLNITQNFLRKDAEICCKGQGKKCIKREEEKP